LLKKIDSGLKSDSWFSISQTEFISKNNADLPIFPINTDSVIKKDINKKIQYKSKCSFIKIKNDIGLRCNIECENKRCKKHINEIIEQCKYFQPTLLDQVEKKECSFIIVIKDKTSKIDRGRKCTSLCLLDQNNNVLKCCSEHINKEQKKYSILEKTCQYTISQFTKKGLKCGCFCVDNNEYCKDHMKRLNLGEFKRAFKVRFYPTKNEKQFIYNKWFGDARKTWNLCINNSKTDNSLDLSILRKKFITKPPYEWLLDTPKEIRDNVVLTYISNVKTNIDLVKRKEKQKFKMKYRSKKNDQTIEISKDAIKIVDNKKIYFYPSIMKEPLHIKKKLDKKLNTILTYGYFNHNIKLTKTKTNKYYLSITYDVEKDIITEKKECISCDPGEISFITTYGINKNKTESIDMTGNRDKLKKWFEEIDDIKSYRDKLKNKIKKTNRTNNIKIKTNIISRINQDIRLKEEKITNRVKDMHYKVIKELVKYKNIYIPVFTTKQMLEKKILPKAVKRALQAQSHYRFRIRLISKAEITNSEVNVCEEHYTTVTCGNCFSINQTSNRVYKCVRCNIKLSRDINAARNIMIKNLTSI